MGTMRTFNAAEWTPVLLVAPDGRTYTPGDHTEHRELLTRGYAVAPEPTPTPIVEPEPTPTPVVEPEPTPPAGETKSKTNRRNGGAL